MCGRFTLSQSSETIAQIFDLADIPTITPRYNIAPTQLAPVVRSKSDPFISEPDIPEPPEREFTALYWGLIPSWAKDPKMGARMINARAETVAEKPSFRAAFKRRRCLVVADGFYEWRRSPEGKQPYYFHLQEHQPFAFAGLWEHWENGNGDVIESCTILTTTANDLLHTIHDRMPVILHPPDHDLWLDPTVTGGDQLFGLLRPYESEAMASYPVSAKVNNPRFDHQDCVQPIEG